MQRYKLEIVASGARFTIPGAAENLCAFSIIVEEPSDTPASIVALLNNLQFNTAVSDTYIQECITELHENKTFMYRLWAYESTHIGIKVIKQHGCISTFGTLI